MERVGSTSFQYGSGNLLHPEPTGSAVSSHFSKVCDPSLESTLRFGKCVMKNLLKNLYDRCGPSLTAHPGFQQTYEKVSASFYIRGLSRAIRTYLQHCPECLVYQTRRHQPHGSMQPIDMPPVPFHTLILDFVLALPRSSEGIDTILSVTDKFSKRVTLISDKVAYINMDWAALLLERLLLADMALPKVILADRDRKFPRVKDC